MDKRTINFNNCIDENQMARNVDLYLEVRKELEKFLFDHDYRKRYIDFCVEKNCIDTTGIEISDEFGNYTKDFAVFIWKELYLNTIFKNKYDFDYRTYKAMDFLINMKRHN